MEEEFQAFKPEIDRKRHLWKSEKYSQLLAEGKTVKECDETVLREIEMVSFDLTPEETELCLKTAKELKFYRLKTSEYFESMKKPRIYTIPTKEQYRKFVIDRIHSMMPTYRADDVTTHFQVSDQFEHLLLYFMNDPEFEKINLHGQYLSLKKGIMLIGPTGVLKTTMMRAFAVNLNQSFAVVDSRDVADQYAIGGPAAVVKYNKMAGNKMPQLYFGQDQLGWCLDDWGTEAKVKNFGNEREVVGEMFSGWYDHHMPFNAIHCTTNHDGDQIEARYGERLRSRCRALFNFITFDKKTEDKRK